MDLIHPSSTRDVARALRSATAERRRVLVVGGRRHLDKGNPADVDAELWTTQLDDIVSHEPAEMIAVVGGGVRVGDLSAVLAAGGQEWPFEAPPDATVGGVVAAAVNSPRRLRVGAVRDTVLEVELVTGDGRLVRGGARTVKNVTGYDLPRLATGSLGTLGVIVQLALKIRPLPKATRTLRAAGVDGLDLGRRLLDAVRSPTAVIATADAVELRLEGWPDEVSAQAAAARSIVEELVELDERAPFPAHRPWEGRPVLVEAAVPPSRIPALLADVSAPWGALVGVGLVWIGLNSADGELAAVRARASAFTGVAPVIRGEGGLGSAPPALEVHRRLREAFDPAGVLAPGRSWGVR